MIIFIMLSISVFLYHALFLVSRLGFVAPVAPLGVSLSIPWGPKGSPYGASLSWFLFIHLVIVLHLLSSFNFPYHV
jgi:hypothetical protein